MKVSVFKNNLEVVLNNFQSFINKKDQSQITSHIFFKLEGEELLLEATDNEIGIKANIKLEKRLDDQNSVGTVNGKKILDIIRRLEEETEITIENDENYLHIKQNKSKFKLPMFNADAFPRFPEYDKNSTLNLDSNSFTDSVEKILPAVDTINPKQELNGMLLNFKEYCFDFVATDTRRLAIVRHESQSINTLSIIVPKRALSELLKLLDKKVEIFYNETQLVMKTGNYEFFTRLINGKYPDYEKIIPKEFKYELELPKSKIADSIRKVISISSIIKITIKTNEIIIESSGDGNTEEGITSIDINTNLEEDFIFKVDSKYLLDSISQIDGDKFNLLLREPNLPFVVKNNNFSTIIMPNII